MTDLSLERWRTEHANWLETGKIPADSPFGPHLSALEALENGQRKILETTVATLAEQRQDDLALVLQLALKAAPTTASPKSPNSKADAPTSTSWDEGSQTSNPVVAALLQSLKGGALRQDAGEESPSLPLQTAVLELLKTPPETLARNRALESSWPRAEQLRVAGSAFAIHGTVTQATIEQAFKEPLVDFNAARWPDLAVDRTYLERWLDAPGEWKTAHKLALKRVLQSPESERAALLAALIHRVHENLNTGAVRENRHLAHAAEKLAESLDLASEAITLGMLADRLQWIEDEHPTPSMLLALWRDESLTTPERTQVARDLLSLERPLPREIAISAQFFLLTNLEDPAEAATLLVSGAAAAPREMLLSGLRQMNADPGRLVHMMALHAILNGQLGPGLEGIRSLIETHNSSGIAQNLFLRIFQALPRDENLPTALLEELGTLIDALRPADWDESTLIPLALTALDFIPELPAGFLQRLLEHFEAETTAQGLAARIFCGYLEDDDRSRCAVRDAGRALRKLPPPAAQDLALQTLAWTAVWGDETLREELAPVVQPLDRFLLRLNSSVLAAAAQRTAQVGAAELRGALMWYFWHREDIDEDPLWLDLCFRAVSVPESLEHLGARIVRWALEQTPGTFAEFRSLVGQRVQTLLSGSSGKTGAREEPSRELIRVLPVLPPDASARRNVFVDRHGELVPDPFSQLALTPHADLDEDVVRTAWVRQLDEFRPEEDPERARLLREARERLLSPEHLYERKFGLLWLPEVPEMEEPDDELPAISDPASGFAQAWHRIIGQLVVYCLVEELVDGT